MAAVFENMKDRRSVRKFTADPVEREVLEQLVEAGTWAPSACNVQAWKFSIVDDPALVQKIDMFSPGMSGNPPALIVVLSDREYALERGGQRVADEFVILDCAYASQNIMLAAAELGLGTCAIKSYNDAAVRKLLQLPENIVIELIITVGHPDPEKELRMPKRKPVSEVAFYNAWSE